MDSIDALIRLDINPVASSFTVCLVGNFGLNRQQVDPDQTELVPRLI